MRVRVETMDNKHRHLDQVASSKEGVVGVACT